MFEKLFAASGLSLDRLRSLLEVGAAGSIAKAAGGDPVRQSQYSRQIRELEDFFCIKLIERHGKGMRLTAQGKELARISRFFLLGLSNFQRGCLAEEQTFRIGASATFIQRFLLPVLSDYRLTRSKARYVTEVTGDDEVERRLHDLTLDFGVIQRATLSRPLQTKEVGRWKLNLWIPKALHRTETSAAQAFKNRQLSLVLAEKELEGCSLEALRQHEPHLACDNFIEAMVTLSARRFATVLPDFLTPARSPNGFLRLRVPSIESQILQFRLAWNPRLLRLNPHATRHRDSLAQWLTSRIAA
jgi:DNA-binding transcriptional LysR family regulator